jgi:nicotinate-nucleotide adenylyltransferase
MRCIGILGGTFDPIHNGHLRTALELSFKLELDHVRFIPAAVPPHREKPGPSADLRLRMVEAAIDGMALFVADRREIERSGPSYSVDTLRSLREEFPESPLGMIVGMDAFIGMPTWHEWPRILELTHVIVARRPGSQPPFQGALGDLVRRSATDNADALHRERNGRILVTSVTRLEISSTNLRNSIAAGVDPRYLVPKRVRDIIIETECYAGKKEEPA